MKVVLVLSIFVISILSVLALAQTGNVSVNFNVTSNGYVTIYLSGLPSSDDVILHCGVQPGPQSSWTQVYDTPMTWNGNNFSATIGPFQNGTWIGWVFHDNTTNTWINYDNHPFWNWNLEVNPPVVGITYATVLSNGSILITTIGRAPDDIVVHYGIASGPQTGLPWSNITDVTMVYNPLWGNYTAVIGPFPNGTWVQWVYHDLTENKYYSNNGQNFAIQVIYTFLTITGGNYDKYVYTINQNGKIFLTVDNKLNSPVNVNIVVNIQNNQLSYNGITLNPGQNNITLPFTASFSQGVYYPVVDLYYSNSLQGTFNLPQLIVLNTTGKRPISLVIVWNMHQPLYLSPQGVWEQPWVWVHTGQDFYWNSSLVGAYELQALLINKYNVSVTIDFTPVLLYQWLTILSQTNPKFASGINVNVTHDTQAVNYTLNLYRSLAQEGKVEVLTVPFYHPLQPIILDNGWWSDDLAQILMGIQMTRQVFNVSPAGTWTPEQAFNMGLITLYNQTGIRYTILDQDAYLPYVTVVSGNTNPYQPFEVLNSLGQSTIVLFRDTALSNQFSFQFFSQPPQLTAQQLIQELAMIYMNNPGGVVTVAFDGENPLIFNPSTGPQDLNAIYQALSQYQGSWLITQTASQAIATHKPYSVITNLPETSWNLNLNYWNNGNPGKIEIWKSVATAREYLVALTKAVGLNLSPVVNLPPSISPNSTNPIATLWNYLYVAEGSDWTWQTGPPSNGPSWFMYQALNYTNAIISTVNQMFSKITLTKANIDGHKLKLTFMNGLNYTLNLVLVVSSGNYNTSYNIVLNPGRNDISVNLPKSVNSVNVYLYSPVTPQDVGASPIPLFSYGFLIHSYSVNSDGSNSSMLTLIVIAGALIIPVLGLTVRRFLK
ncbi:glycoside hydrolase [Sulfolobus acidocaldarius]|uniref:glycoside hydrolase n=1 Tax=Sulfolobus acidocaldarius TaxID=2285 RepID=UPI000B5A92DF|nr:glycoside hydrolase [Sulfolobus acidocaldarius]